MSSVRTFSLTGGPYAPTAARLALLGLACSLPGVRERLRLLVTELVTNSVKHGGAGGAGRVGLLIRVTECGVRVEVSDPGAGFDPGRVARDADLDSGWGLYLVNALADRWGVTHGDRMRVWFELLCPPDARKRSDEARVPSPRRASVRAAVRRPAATRTRGRTQRQARLDEATRQVWVRDLERD